MSLVELIRQAVGTDPAQEDDWESLQSPETDLLPTVAARLAAPSPKAQGLRRYTWLRYQMLLGLARKVAELSSDLLLADDLHLAGHHYAHPSDRVLHGIDFLAPRGWDRERQESLQELGWQKPSWPDGADFSEWLQPDGTRLRFHWEWLKQSKVGVEDLRPRSVVGKHGLLALSDQDQLYRGCFQGPSHLWMVDAVTVVAGGDGLAVGPEGLSCLAWRWNRLCFAQSGYQLNLSYDSKWSWTPARWVLALTHRSLDPYSNLLGEVAIQLVCGKHLGWPHQWMQALQSRWKLSSYLQIPRAYFQRRRGDFS